MHVRMIRNHANMNEGVTMLRTPVQNDIIAIYETRKTRVTKAHTQVLDLRPIGSKYAMHCVTHCETQQHRTRLEAESLSHKPQLWCTACAHIADAPEDAPTVTVEVNVEGASDAPVIEVNAEDVIEVTEVLEIESGVEAPHGFTASGNVRRTALKA